MARSLLLGAALGLATRLVYHGPDELMWMHKVGAPWLAAAFFIGALRQDWRAATGEGAAALVVAVLVYYGIPGYTGGGAGAAWLWVAVPAGWVFGALGALWRTSDQWRLAATAVLAGCFLGEAALWYGRGRPLVALVEYTVAVVLVAQMLPRASERLTAGLGAAWICSAAIAGELAVYLSLNYLVG